jgi:translocation and assembly module TamA
VAILAPSTACIHARGPVDRPAVIDFRLEGLKRLDARDLKKGLATQESRSALAVPIVGPMIDSVRGPKERKADLIDEAQLAVDRERVLAYCRDHGYYDARVVDARIVEVGEGQARVILRIEEGAPIRVQRIELEGLDEAPEAAAALVEPALRVGDVFQVAKYDALREQVLTALQNNGWATAEVQQGAQVLPEAHAAVLRYTVRAGPRFRFGPTSVRGTRERWASRVAEEVAQEIEQGAPYDESKLAKARARVFGLGVFSSVDVSRGAADAGGGALPVQVTVREGRFHEVRLGPSAQFIFGNRVEVTAEAGWTDRHFLGDIRRLDLTLSGGYAWLLAPPQNEGPIGMAAAEMYQRAVWWQKVDLGIRLELQRVIQQGYDYWAQIGRITFPIHLSRRTTFAPSYHLEVYELSNTIDELDPNDPNETNKLLQSCPDPICVNTYLQQRIEYDGRDDPVEPRSGYYLALTLREGFRVGAWGYQYLGLLPEARVYFPVGARSVLATRARFGAFIPVQESSLPPTVAIFEGGGSNSMRGYALERFSPMRCVTKVDASGNEACTDEWVPEGGNGLAEYSAELRFPIRGSLHGVVFLDAAYVSRRSAVPTTWTEVFSFSNLQWAAGFGVRLRTPVGPVRLDVAVRLPTDLSRGVEFEDRFPPVPPSSQDPDPGPHREPIAAVHFTFGEAY